MFSRIIMTLRASTTEPSLRKLRNRLLTVNLVSLTLVVVVAFSLVYIDYYNRTQNKIDQALDSIPPGVFENIMLSQKTMDSNGTGHTQDDEAMQINGGPVIPVDYSKSFVANIKDDDIVIFSMLDIAYEEYEYAVKTVIEKGSVSGELDMADRTWQYCIKQSSDQPQGTVAAAYESSIIFLDVEEASRGLRELAISLFVIAIVAIGAILLVSLLVANRAIRPVEDSIIRQRRFVADASHELKTPIAVIAANAEAAKDAVYRTDCPALIDSENAASVTRWIDNISDEAYHMDSLVKNLLALARAEELEILAVPFDVYDAIRAEADRVETFLFEKNITFAFDPPPQNDEPLIDCSDRAKMQSILAILFENAVKYTPDGGRVTITAGKTEQEKEGQHSVWISVSNTGAYIPPEDIARIFDRFFRADRSRNSETGGHGIGLSIAREIARTLGGKLTATSVKDQGGDAVNTFTLYL